MRRILLLALTVYYVTPGGSEVYLTSDSTFTAPIDLGVLPVGQVVQFGEQTPAGQMWMSGPASLNPDDGWPHDYATQAQPSDAPEPASLGLASIGIGMILFGGFKRRK